MTDSSILLQHYARLTIDALRDLYEQVGENINWSKLNDLYEMQEFIKSTESSDT